MKKTTIITAIALTLGAATYCHAEGEINASELWGMHCKKCHAEDGSGNTKAGKKLNLADYTKAEEQAKFTDEEALKAILEGVKDDAGKETMKPFKEKLQDGEAEALVKYTRTLVKKEG